MEQAGIAAVGKTAMAVDALLVEAERHAIQARNHVEPILVHQLGCFGLQQSGTVIEMGDHEFAHVRTGCRQASGRCRVDDLELLSLLRRRAPIALRHEGLQVLRQRLPEAGVLHADRLEDVLVDIVVERHARLALDDVAGQCGRIVGIGRRRASIESAIWQAFLHELVERNQLVGIVVDEVPDGFLEPRRMRHDIAHRDRLAVRARGILKSR